MKWPFAGVAWAAFAHIAVGQTFVVDAANGPGTNFRDLATATAAVPSGSALLGSRSTAPDVPALAGLRIVWLLGRYVARIVLPAAAGLGTGRVVRVPR